MKVHWRPLARRRTWTLVSVLSAWLLSRPGLSPASEPNAPEIRIDPVALTFSPTAASVSQVPDVRPSAVELPTALEPVLATRPDAKVLDPLQIEQDFAKAPLVNVIVNLAAPRRTRVPPGVVRRRLNRAGDPEIHRVQDEVLESLPRSEVRLRFKFGHLPSFSASVTPGALKALQDDPRVLSIEPVYTLEPHLAQGVPLIGGTKFRSVHNGAGVAIAVCDTGIDYNHPFLGGGGFPNGKVLGGYDFGDDDADPIPNGQPHGTACAGIAAGNLGAVGDYIGGVAHNAKLYALKISSGNASTATTDALVGAWDWCITHQYDDPNNPILVISTSFGAGRFFASCDSEVPSLAAAADNAVAAGITIVASSGNEGYCDSIAWPSCISSVLAIGAVYDAPIGNFAVCIDAASCAPKIAVTGCASGWYCDDITAVDRVASFGNMAPILSLLAPANRCYTLDISGKAGSSQGDFLEAFGGTSAACPYAAGAVACLQSAALALTGEALPFTEVKSRLMRQGDPIEDSKSGTITPRIQLARAIQTLPNAGQTFRIYNDGTAPLNVLAITNQTPSPWISVFPAGSFTLPGGQYQEVTVRVDFAKAPPGQTIKHLLVASTDADESPSLSGIDIVVNNHAQVVGRHIFYNQSAFDGDDPVADVRDDAAVAIDKSALLPGGKATLANYTSYSRGINGIMIDIAGLFGTPEAGDFDFQMSERKTSPGWLLAPAPDTISVRSGAGFGGSARVTLTWPRNAIDKRWLRVAVKASAHTGLAADDVFYFGNAIGEAGDSLADAKVDASDQLLARGHQRTLLNPAPVDYLYDFDRDRKVDATDQLIARFNQTSISALPLLDLSAPVSNPAK